jgi:hypothetical protein
MPIRKVFPEIDILENIKSFFYIMVSDFLGCHEFTFLIYLQKGTMSKVYCLLGGDTKIERKGFENEIRNRQ